jgi:iron complex outermembrane receptor protein
VFGGLATSNTALVNAKLSILRGQTYAAMIGDGALTGRANIAWQVTDNVLGYASFARGAKSGGINMSGLPLNDQNLPALGTAVVKPEQNTAYEIGLKTRLFDNRLIFNIDGYYTRVTDFQSNVSDTRAAVALRTYLANIPLVTVKGFEADATALVTRDFSLRASVAYADGRNMSGIPNGPCPIELIGNTAAPCNLTGVGLPGLPKWSTTVEADYAHAFGSAAARPSSISTPMRVRSSSATPPARASP